MEGIVMSNMKDILNQVITKNTNYNTWGDTYKDDLENDAKCIIQRMKTEEEKIKESCYLISLFEKDLASKYSQLMQLNARFGDPKKILQQARAIVNWNKLKKTKKQKDMTEEELALKPTKEDTHIVEYVARSFFGEVANKYKPTIDQAMSYGFHDNAIELIFTLDGIDNVRFEVTIPVSPMSEEATEARAYQYIIRSNEKWKNKDLSYRNEWSNSYEWIAGDFGLEKVRDKFVEYFKNKFEVTE